MVDQSSRIHGSVLARIEGKILRSTAAALPDWVRPDMLTAIGIGGSSLSFISYAASALWPAFLFVASLGLIINWFGDSLDGTLARVRNQERPRYGFFVDHSADLVSQVLIGLGFGLSHFISLSTALLLLTGYLAFVAHTFIRARVFGVVQIAYYSVGPTETRLAMIAANMALFFLPWASRPMEIFPISPADVVGNFFAIISFAALALQIFTDWRILAREERDILSTHVEGRPNPAFKEV